MVRHGVDTRPVDKGHLHAWSVSMSRRNMELVGSTGAMARPRLGANLGACINAAAIQRLSIGNTQTSIV